MEAEGDVATAFTLARILSDIPLSRGGPTSVVIFDIHALQERFYFGDTVLPLFESGIPLLRARLKSLPDADNVTIAYPDEGAWKRFHYQFGDYPEVVSWLFDKTVLTKIHTLYIHLPCIHLPCIHLPYTQARR